MDNKIVQAVLERSKGLCENCGTADYMSQFHHIIGGRGKRKQHETVESVILLCWDCHHGTNGWHSKNSLSIKIKLRLKLQEIYFNQGYTESEVRKKMGGKLY